ncbi:ABC transporter ATP-binding protein [Candidatus Saccharibacteria bacterium]|nr:ABC transporter ATP-binding protein [Candidatus Saccharibacteria bacterium]MBQ68638.1 ABC transporter ATP-binding protein [Candidatus Saccharibacteria bacterium]|tara:strand:- start:4364 stop:5545 length:1182 start_codon:yes stop_codon:yes gene_type:complete
MKKDIAIKVSNVSKSFRLPHEKVGSIKNAIVNWRKKQKGYETQRVLKDISFEIEKGDFFGIVGRNGSGKSTLLKVMSQIYAPDKGKVSIHGKLVPFIELGVGFNPELTGRENVFLNGALLGFSREETEAKYQDIVEFAELERFMDQKLKNYSSGMQVRLAFSIAIQADGDILLLDEVLAVGDEAFQRKCNDYFDQLKQEGKTVILVTHSMDAVRKYCNKALMLQKGKVLDIGSPEDISNRYSIENLGTRPSGPHKHLKGDMSIKDLQVQLISQNKVAQDEIIEIRVSYRNQGSRGTYPVCDLVDLDRNVPLVTAGSSLTKREYVSRSWKIKLSSINNTNIAASVAVRDEQNEVLAFVADSDKPKFILRRNDYPDPMKPTTYALLFEKGEWNEQ